MSQIYKYTSFDGAPFAYAPEQESLRLQRISEGHKAISEEVAVAMASGPVMTPKELASSAMAKVNSEYTKRMGTIASTYPVHERESWPVQLQEANLLLAYAEVVPMPDVVKTPWIDQCAHQRGLDRMELAQRIAEKDAAYRTVSGFLSGVRQWHEDCIDMLLEEGQDAREALQGYDHLQGWVREVSV